MNPNRHVTKIFGDGLILARQNGHRVFVFNSSARFIWERVCENIPFAEIQMQMAAHFGIDTELAARDLATILAGWQNEGLIPPQASSRHYWLGGVSMTIFFASPVAQAAFTPLFCHAETTKVSSNSDHAHLDLEIRDVKNGFEIRCDGAILATATSKDELLEFMTAKLVGLVHDRSANILSLHSAAVGVGTGAVLMPGQSGSGKSTLTAALVAAGHAYYTDDTVLLNAQYQVIPLPSPLVLKGTKWPSLDAILPDIEKLPVYHRLGNDVRYWSPPKRNIAQNDLPVKAIIFPTFQSDAPFETVELSPLETLERIVAASCMVRTPISDKVLQGLIDWLEPVPSYAMSYGTLAAPMKFITDSLAHEQK